MATVRRFRKKPVVIDAHCFGGGEVGWKRLIAWLEALGLEDEGGGLMDGMSPQAAREANRRRDLEEHLTRLRRASGDLLAALHEAGHDAPGQPAAEAIERFGDFYTAAQIVSDQTEGASDAKG